MDLNEFARFASLDAENMLAHIDGLPQQLLHAWKSGMAQALPVMQSVDRIVVAGMGGSAIGADLLTAYLADKLPIPMIVHRDYGLPGYARGTGTLVVISSHSGNTEESLSAFDQAYENGCQVIAVCTGGKLQQKAVEKGFPVWMFQHNGQPRAAVGYSFGLLLALIVRLGLLPDVSAEIEDAVKVMTDLQTKIKADVPVLSNPAKRLAGQLIGRHVTVFGSNFMAPVARRWKCQINEVAKAIASFEFLPEADHNTLAGINHPQQQMGHELALFLRASADHPRNIIRVDKTREILMLEGIGTDFFNARGETKLAQMWSTVLFGDYMAYYLAICYDTDPTPIPAIITLKESMSD
ncbi:MAG: bifunctional phosphoglucose/phosphomannose isomerase [Anaerolineaceae bacterium]|mgnify:FL=1|nr:bifunctional phosphoglucose/phosphomannose isomerase [Anaerolineaceae bacterium]